MNGIDVLLAAAGLLLLLWLVYWIEWKLADKQRRLERLRKRNLA